MKSLRSRTVEIETQEISPDPEEGDIEKLHKKLVHYCQPKGLKEPIAASPAPIAMTEYVLLHSLSISEYLMNRRYSGVQSEESIDVYLSESDDEYGKILQQRRDKNQEAKRRKSKGEKEPLINKHGEAEEEATWCEQHCCGCTLF